MAISGWVHVALVYKAGAPSIYVDGKLAGQAEASGAVVHPGVHDASERDGAEYFDGDMSDPELFKEALSEERIRSWRRSPAPAPSSLLRSNGQAARAPGCSSGKTAATRCKARGQING